MPLKFYSMLCLLCTLCNTCPNIMIIIITVGTCQYIITTILKFSIWIISNSDQCVEIRQCRIYSKLRRPLVILWQGIAQQMMQMRSCLDVLGWCNDDAALFTNCPESLSLLSLLAGLVGAVPATMCCCAVTRPPTTAWWQWCTAGNEPSRSLKFHKHRKGPNLMKAPKTLC